MPQSIHVVCFGKDVRLLETREAVLAKEFRTTPVTTLISLLQLSSDCSFEVAVLCHTLPQEEYQQAIVALQSLCPRAGIVALTAAGTTSTPEGADHSLRGLDGPHALLATIHATLTERHLAA